MKEGLKIFIDMLWKIGSFIIIFGLFVLFGWFIYKKKADKTLPDKMKEAIGVITNPAKDIDKSRSDKLKEAIDVLWKE